MTMTESRQAVEPVTELHAMLAALVALRKGDATVRLPLHWTGVAGRVADAFNDVVEQNATLAEEITRLRKVVGKEGQLKQRASLREARGFWGESVDCINSLIDDLVHPTSEVARVIGAVAQGDLSRAWRSRSMAGRSRASSCARPRRSTRWSTSSGISRPR
jgi:hypothetical protein